MAHMPQRMKSIRIPMKKVLFTILFAGTAIYAQSQTTPAKFLYQPRWLPGKSVRIEVEHESSGTTHLIGNTSAYRAQLNLTSDSFRSKVFSRYHWVILPGKTEPGMKPAFDCMVTEDSLAYFQNGALFPLRSEKLLPVQFSAIPQDGFGGMQIARFTPMPEVAFNALVNTRMTAQQEMNVVNMLFPGPLYLRQNDPTDVIEVKMARVLPSDSSTLHTVNYSLIKVADGIAEIAVQVRTMRFPEAADVNGYRSQSDGEGILRYDIQSAFPVSLTYTTRTSADALLSEGLTMKETSTETTRVKVVNLR